MADMARRKIDLSQNYVDLYPMDRAGRIEEINTALNKVVIPKTDLSKKIIIHGDITKSRYQKLVNICNRRGVSFSNAVNDYLVYFFSGLDMRESYKSEEEKVRVKFRVSEYFYQSCLKYYKPQVLISCIIDNMVRPSYNVGMNHKSLWAEVDDGKWEALTQSSVKRGYARPATYLRQIMFELKKPSAYHKLLLENL